LNKVTKNLATSVIFMYATAQSKQSPFGRNLAQSGHPACEWSKKVRRFYNKKRSAGFIENHYIHT
jgi:hypothetical protein